MKTSASLLALIFWAAPWIGAVSVVCDCEPAAVEAVEGALFNPVSCCADDARPCCFEENTAHGAQPLANERTQENRVEWKPVPCLVEWALPGPIRPDLWKLGAASSRGPPSVEMDAQIDLQVWLI